MSHSVRVLCRPQVAPGFAVAGLVPLEASDPVDAADRMRELLRQPAAGVVLVEDALYDRFPDDLGRQVARRPLPMVVPFPGPVRAERPERPGPEAYIVDLLRQVIGYRVRLK